MTTTIGAHAATLPEGYLTEINFPVMLQLDEETPDGRIIESAGFSSRDLPQSIGFMRTRSSMGHDGAEVGGMVDEVTIEDNGTVSGKGWLLDDSVGQTAARLVKAKALTGNSVDLAIKDYAVEVDGEKLKFRVTESKFAGTTLVPIPAFEGAFAELPEDFQITPADDALVASLANFSERPSVAFAAVKVKVEHPSSEFFANPLLVRPTPIVVADDGLHVYGHLATWGTEHLNAQGVSLTPPRSKSGYAYFATGHVLTDAGQVETGRLVIGGQHAPEDLGWREALDFYASTSAAWADVNIGEDDIGIWFAGMVRPGTPDATVYAARASALSGDWRQIRGTLEAVTALSVNAPGFPIPAPSGFAHMGEQLSLTGAGVLTPRPLLAPSGSLSAANLQSIQYLAQRAATEEAREIAAALRAEES